MAQFLYNLYKRVIEEEKKVTQSTKETIRNCIQWILDKYSNDGLKQSDSINFDIPGNRCAYVYLYATSHSCMIIRSFEKFREDNLQRYIDWITHFRSSWSLNICSIGAGPGTDIVGFLMFFRHRLNLLSGVKVNCTLIDKYPSWKMIFDKILNNLRTEVFDDLLSMTTKYLTEDLFSCLSPSVRISILEADLIIMSKFVSAVSARSDCFSILKNIFQIMKQGALFLFIDNSGGCCYKKMYDAAIEAGLKPVLGPIQHAHFQISSSVKSIRSDIIHDRKIFGASPQENSKISVVIWEKPYEINNLSLPMNAYCNNQTSFGSYYKYLSPYQTSSPINTYHENRRDFNSSYDYPSPCERSPYFDSKYGYSSNISWQNNSLNGSLLRSFNNSTAANSTHFNRYNYPRTNYCHENHWYSDNVRYPPVNFDLSPLKENIWHSNQLNNSFIDFKDNHLQMWHNSDFLNNRKRKRTDSAICASNKRTCFRI